MSIKFDETLSSIIGDVGPGGIQDRNFMMIALKAVEPREVRMVGEGDTFGLSLERAYAARMNELAESRDMLFYLISAKVSKKLIDDFLEGDNSDTEGFDENEKYPSGGDEIHVDPSGSVTRAIARILKSSIDSSWDTSSSPFLVSRFRRGKSLSVIETRVTMKDISDGLGRSIEFLESRAHHVHVDLAEMVIKNEEAYEGWFMTESMRHDRLMASQKTVTRREMGIDMGALRCQTIPPINYFYDDNRVI